MDQSLQNFWLLCCLSLCCLSVAFFVLSATVTRWLGGMARRSVRQQRGRFRSRYDLGDVLNPRGRRGGRRGDDDNSDWRDIFRG